MPIEQSDIKIRLSGGASNAIPAAALGGAMSSTEAGGNVFDDVSAVESAAGDIEYRCVYVENTHPTLTLVAAVLWISANTPSPSTALAAGPGTSALNGTEQTVANEGTAPTGVTFTAAATPEIGVALGDLPPGGSRAAWIRRTTNAACPAVDDTAQLRVTGTTAP